MVSQGHILNQHKSVTVELCVTWKDEEILYLTGNEEVRDRVDVMDYLEGTNEDRTFCRGGRAGHAVWGERVA
jgi:hypothetical protein